MRQHIIDDGRDHETAQHVLVREEDGTLNELAVVDGGSVERAPNDHLLALYTEALRQSSEGMKAYLASLVVDRGILGACHCSDCERVREYARRWQSSSP